MHPAGRRAFQNPSRYLAAGLFAVLLLLLSPRAQAAPLPGVPADLLITLQRNGCESGCAAYTLELRADGIVVFDVRSGVRHPGQFRGLVRPEALRALAARIDAMGFFDLADEYGTPDTAQCQAVRDGGQLVVIWVRMGGSIKRVTHDHRCVGSAPDGLSALEDAIDEAGQVARWLP